MHSPKPSEAEVHRFGIGASQPRYEDLRLVRGAGHYTDDFHFAGEASLVFLRSSHAAARIKRIDVAAAREAPGVVAIYTGKDVADAKLGHIRTMIPRQRPDGKPMIVPPYPLLAADAVRYVGDPVAAVIAETAAAAQQAAELIEVEYDEQPSVTDVSQAIKPEAAKVWPGLIEDNVSYLAKMGNATACDAAFANAHHVTEATYRITRVYAVPMEPRSAIGQHDPVEDRYTLYVGSQSPHGSRAELTGVLGIPLNKLRVVSPDVGGGFGMKGGSYPEYALILWIAKQLKRPVRWTATRSEAFLGDYHGRDSTYTAKLALDAEGNFLAIRVDGLANCGAYLGMTTPIPPANNFPSLVGVYRTPAAYVEITGVHTHTQPLAPYRGAGRPEATYIMERLIDQAAIELDRDRVELRRRNLIPQEAMPFKTALIYTYDSGAFEQNMDMVLEKADWKGFPKRRDEAKKRGKLRGISLVNAIEIAGGPYGKPAEEFAEIKFDAGGNATILTGGHNHGQGQETSYRQVVVSQLGLDPARTRVVFGDTDIVDHGFGTFGSRSMMGAGTALVRSSEKIIERGRELASHFLEASKDDITFEAGSFAVAGTDKKIRIEEIAKASYSFMRMPPNAELGLAARSIVSISEATFPNGSHVCEVEVDPETGTVEVVGYAIVDDVGTMINPMLVKGQLHGGVAQGLGQALFEDIQYDPSNGQLITASFMDYALPRADDMPSIDIATNPVPTTKNPLGAKGAGEAGTVGGLPAVVMAVADALRPLGVTDIGMPTTAERVWQAIRDAALR
jgi:carbon-monoxide dehydrogenase large subunit